MAAFPQFCFVFDSTKPENSISVNKAPRERTKLCEDGYGDDGSFTQ